MAVPRPSPVARYTIVGQRWLSVTPCNMGTQPAEWACSARSRDEHLGFEILHGLGDGQRKAAVIHHVAPADYTDPAGADRVGKVEYPDYLDLGISWYQINDEDREAFKFRRTTHAASPAPTCPPIRLAQPRRSRRVVRRAACHDEVAATAHGPNQEPMASTSCGSAGPGARRSGTPHYYRIQGSRPAHRVRQHDRQRQPHPLGVGR